MTTYNTGNPIGSTDARDLYDNAQNLDNFANGSAASYTDRLGVSRRSLSGIDSAADNVLNSIGYAVPVAYTSGISLTLTSQTVDYNGVIYAPKSSALPFTTSSWGSDAAKFRAIQVTDANLITYTPAGTGAVDTNVQSKLREAVSVLDFGADPTGATFSDVSVQAAYTYAHENKKKLVVPAGYYKFGAGISKPSSFHSVDIIGDGADVVTFDYSAMPSGGVMLTLQGGSGSVTQSKIEGIYFLGNAGTTGIEIIGQGGVIPYRCRFGANARGITLHNKNAGEFTEFCVATTCEFTGECRTALEYERTAGNDSFHGSGLFDCLINAHSAVDPVVLVGAGCFVYNAPMSVHLFPPASESCNLIYNKQVSGSLNNNWYGTLTLEPNSTYGISLAINDTGARTFYAGNVLSVNQNYSNGAMVFVDSLKIRSDGAASYTPKPYTVTTTGVTSGGAVDLNLIDAYVGYDSGLLLNVTLVAANYRYTHLLSMSLDNGSGGGNQVAQLAVLQQFNSAGFGASTFSVDASGRLVVTNASPGFSVTAVVGVSPVGF